MKRITWAVIALIIGFGVNATAQTEKKMTACVVGSTAPAVGYWTWAGNSHVRVYIRAADVTDDEGAYIATAVRNWDASYDENGSGVRFEYLGRVDEAKTCSNCLTILRGRAFNKQNRHVTELRAFSARSDQVIDYASIVIDPVLTNPKALTDAVAHELGHSLGLLDCYSCKRNSTVMNQLKTVNSVNGTAGPTACDQAQVKEAYRQLLAHVRPSPAPTLLTPPDEGEEPVEDDTPVVLPKP